MDGQTESDTLEANGMFLLCGDVDAAAVAQALAFLHLANLKRSRQELTLVIHSTGGDCASGFALTDAMTASKIPVHTVGTGCVASTGLSVFIAGTKGQRILTPNTLVMCHQWSWSAEGKEHELFAAIKHHRFMRTLILRHYQQHTGLSRRDVRKYLFPPHDVFLTPQEAKKLGLCDIVRNY